MLRKIIASGMAITFLFTTAKPAQSNPAILPAASGLCGTGIGCVFVGTVIIGGVLYYVYTHQGKKVYSHQMIDDPENPEEEWFDTSNLRGEVQAEKKCKEIASRHGAIFVRKERNKVTGIFECFFKGGNK